MSTTLDGLVDRFQDRTATIGVIGLGYVGLPLAMAFVQNGYTTTGFDLNKSIVAALNAGTSHIADVPDGVVRDAIASGRLTASAHLDALVSCDVIVICVPTPLNKMKDPDLSYVLAATWSIRDALRPGQLVILESTTFPGTTREVVLPVLAESGLQVGHDVFVCFSPERVDPGNQTWRTENTPKVIGGATPACLAAGMALYQTVFQRIVPVSTLEAAELTKVYENTFRLINIALANELAQECEKLGVDVWEVIDAAATKPFGFMRFTPGPGIGGHCIPLDPHYLSWKMRTLAYKTRMIEVASEINSEMPGFVVQRVADALNDEAKAVRGSRILILGVAYKRDVGDMRESTAFEIMHLLQAKGAHLLYHDALCPVIDGNSSLPLEGLPLHSVDLSDDLLADVDAVVIVTDHSGVDYGHLAEKARLVIDTRGVMRRYVGSARVIGLSGKELSLHGSGVTSAA